MRVFFLASVLVYQSFAFSCFKEEEEEILGVTLGLTYVVIMERSEVVHRFFEVVAYLIVLFLVLAHVSEERQQDAALVNVK